MATVFLMPAFYIKQKSYLKPVSWIFDMQKCISSFFAECFFFWMYACVYVYVCICICTLYIVQLCLAKSIAFYNKARNRDFHLFVLEFALLAHQLNKFDQSSSEIEYDCKQLNAHTHSLSLLLAQSRLNDCPLLMLIPLLSRARDVHISFAINVLAPSHPTMQTLEAIYTNKSINK